MRITEPERFREALRALLAGQTYRRVSADLSRASGGTLHLDAVQLHRLATGPAAVTRLIDSPATAIVFTVCLMGLALGYQHQPARVLELGRIVLERLLGPTLAQIVFVNFHLAEDAPIDQHREALHRQSSPWWHELAAEQHLSTEDWAYLAHGLHLLPPGGLPGPRRETDDS